MIIMTARDYMKNEVERLYAEELKAITSDLYKGLVADLDERLVEADIHRSEAIESLNRRERLKNGDQAIVSYWREES